MMEKLKYTKFKTLLISSFICISIIPVVLLGLFIFHLSKQELIRQSEKQMWQNAENVSDILDEKLDYIEEFSLKINVDTRIYKIFQNLDTSDSMQLESASQEISKILLDYLPWNNTVYSTHIVTPYYQFGEKEKNYYQIIALWVLKYRKQQMRQMENLCGFRHIIIWTCFQLKICREIFWNMSMYLRLSESCS